MVSKDILDDLHKFLLPDTRPDVKLIASHTISQLTGNDESIKVILKRRDIIEELFMLIEDKQVTVSENSLKALVNLSANENNATTILYTQKTIVQKLLKIIVDASHPYADLACGLLANITRVKDNNFIVIPLLEETSNNIEKLVSVFCQTNYNKKGASLNLLGSCISNLTQINKGRRLVLKKDLVEKLISFIGYPGSTNRRKSAVGILHNCCFEKEHHMWLLSDDVCIASFLALPLAGPDTFTDEENDNLPLDLQYLPDTKKREQDPSIRLLLLESFMQLCATSESREYLREQNIYYILREYHNWETDHKCFSLLEDVINILIKNEEEMEKKDLSEVKVPEDIALKFDAHSTEVVNDERPVGTVIQMA